MEKAFTGESYIKLLKNRQRRTHVSTPHQHTGLLIAVLLDDPSHKSLYMKLAKLYNPAELLVLAKNVSDRKNVKNKGAYFMRVVTERIKEDKTKKKPNDANSNDRQKRKRGVSTKTDRGNKTGRRSIKAAARARQVNEKDHA